MLGLGLNLPGNAVRALRDLGVDGKLTARGVPVRRREYRNARNRLLFAVDEAGFWGAGAGSICVLRAMFWSFSAPASRSLRCVGAQR